MVSSKRTPTPKSPKASFAALQRAHLDRMDAYVRGIADGSVYSAKPTRQGMQRHLRDLERQADPDFPFYFDVEQAARAIHFCHALSHVKGDTAGEPLILPEWGLFMAASTFGWRWKSDPRRRRFKFIYGWVPRGNAKSTILSALSLYATFAEGGQKDAFSFATKREQAEIVWGDARKMLNGARAKLKGFGIEDGAKALIQVSSHSSFKPMPSEDKHLDGLNIAWAVMDETHRITPALWEVVETGIGKRLSACMISISTAGDSISGLGYAKYSMCRQLLAGELDPEIAEVTFALIYEAPEGADPYEEATWRAANPLYDHNPAIRADLRAKAAKAKKLSTDRRGFLVKHLNIWQTTAAPFFDLEAWDACKDPTLDRSSFEDERCWIGLDLANREDIAAKALVFPVTEDDGSTGYTVFLDCYLPQGAIDDGRNLLYQQWKEDGFLTATDGKRTDFRVIEDDIREDRSRYAVEMVCCDPEEANQMLGNLGDAGMTVTEVRTTFKDMNDPMKALEQAIVEGRVHHDGNPVLRWMVSNTCAKTRDDQVRPVKEAPGSTKKIDGVVAILNALRHCAGEPASAYAEASGFIVLGDETTYG